MYKLTFIKGYKLKYILMATLLFLLMGCTHREYMNNGSSLNNVQQDQAQCALESEKSVAPANSGTNIIVNTASNLSKKERQELAQERASREESARWERQEKVRELTDLCLQARGWTWIDVKDK